MVSRPLIFGAVNNASSHLLINTRDASKNDRCDTVCQSQELMPLTAHPRRPGNSTLRSV